MTITPATPDRKRVGPYTIIERLGEGGMGVVYRAKSKNTQAAVKVIRASMLEREDIRTRFSREIETLKTVDSNFVARILDSDLSKKTAWLATEFVEGPTLKNLVDEQGPLSESEWWELAEGLLRGCQAIHDAGVIHQDLKPANIMMSPEGPKVIDFGISREVDATRVTGTGLFAGSAGWMAPERAELGVETTLSDIFSAGLVLAFAARGKHPWDGETTQSDVALTLNMLRLAPDLSGLSDRQRNFVASLLERKPENRPSAQRALGMINGTIAVPEGKKAGGKVVVRQPPAFTLQASLAKGFGLAVAFLGLAIFFGLFLVDLGGRQAAAELVEKAGWLAGNAVGFSPLAGNLPEVLTSSTHATNVLALRPTLLTGLVFFAVYLLSYRLSTRFGMGGIRHHLIHGSALILPVMLVTFVFRGLTGSSGPLALVLDVMFGIAVLALAYIFGHVSAQIVLRESALGWYWLALRRSGLLASGLVLATAVSLAGFTMFAPVFMESGAGMGTGTPNVFSPQEYVSLYGYVLAHLPSILALMVSLVVSGQAGIYLLRDNSVALQFLQNTDSDAQTTALIPQDIFLSGFAFAVVAGVAVISGTSAALRSGLSPKNFTLFGKIIGLSIAMWALIVWLMRADAPGAGTLLNGSLFFQPNLSSLLASMALSAIIGLIFAGGLILGAQIVVSKAVFQSVPRATLGIEVLRAGTSEQRLLLGRIVGLGVVGALTVAFVVPVGIGFGERAFATENSPLALAEDYAELLELKDADGLKAMYPEVSGGIPWLPDPILESVRPDLGRNKNFDVDNNSGRAWNLGELDATATVEWPSPDGAIQWEIPMEATVERRFGYFRVAQYTANIEPVTVDISVDDISRELEEVALTVNSFPLEPGEYYSVPGLYKFAREGVQLLAPFETQFVTTTSSVRVEIVSKLALPAGAVGELSAAVASITENCGSLRSGRCFAYSEIAKNMKLLNGRAPANFYSKTDSGYVEGRLNCGQAKSTLLGVQEMLYTVDCFKLVSENSVFYNSRQIAEPVYSTRCARFGYSWWFGLYCARYEQYQSGTNYRTVRGDVIARASYSSEVPFRVTVRAELEDDGNFAIRETGLR